MQPPYFILQHTNNYILKSSIFRKCYHSASMYGPFCRMDILHHCMVHSVEWIFYITVWPVLSNGYSTSPHGPFCRLDILHHCMARSVKWIFYITVRSILSNGYSASLYGPFCRMDILHHYMARSVE
jgi:tRNA pseudouridine-54 N-methylase